MVGEARHGQVGLVDFGDRVELEATDIALDLDDLRGELVEGASIFSNRALLSARISRNCSNTRLVGSFGGVDITKLRRAEYSIAKKR